MMNRKEDRTGHRADIAFALYWQMEGRRSLRQLHAQLRTLGVRIGLATLKRYSAKHSWQGRIAELEAKAVERQRERTIGDLLAMRDRHAQLGRALQGAGGSALRKLMASEPRLAKMKTTDIARLVETGLRAERHAVAEATDRQDIAIATWNSVTTEMVALFSEVNGEADPGARARFFARGVDRVVDRHLAEVIDGLGPPYGR
jgi:hypothetical protein